MRADLAMTTHNRVISAKLPLTRPAATLPQGGGLFIGFLSLHRPEPDFFAGLILQIGLALQIVEIILIDGAVVPLGIQIAPAAEHKIRQQVRRPQTGAHAGIALGAVRAFVQAGGAVLEVYEAAL